MKVLFISSGNSINGINPIIIRQGESLRKIGIEVNYFVINRKGIISYLKHIFILRGFLKNKHFDVFHSHYSYSSMTAILSGCNPLIVSLMGSDIESGILQRSLIRIMANLKWIEVIVKSESMKKKIRIRKAHIIPNGVDLVKVKPTSDSSNFTTKNTVLFAANPLRSAKNYILAKRAFSFIEDNINVELKIVHSKSHATIIKELNKAAVLLLTSRYEGSPNIIKEAMACNCPIVSTNVGDVRWLLGNENGHFLTSFEPEDISEKIRLALDFSKRNGRTNGRQRIIDLGLDAETIATRISKLYEEINDHQQ